MLPYCTALPILTFLSTLFIKCLKCIDGTEPTFNDYLIRNISRIVPFDTLSFFGENGWHDKWSETRVINMKNYQAEIQAKSEIEDLGKKEIA